MLRKSMKRQTAGLALATLLAMSAPAAAAGAFGGHDGEGLWAGVWSWIEALWDKKGDRGTTPAGGGEQGSHIDPNGQPCATCSGDAGTTVDGARDAGIDPDGEP